MRGRLGLFSFSSPGGEGSGGIEHRPVMALGLCASASGAGQRWSPGSVLGEGRVSWGGGVGRGMDSE